MIGNNVLVGDKDIIRKLGFLMLVKLLFGIRLNPFLRFVIKVL